MNTAAEFSLDPRLAADCHRLGELHGQVLLLMNNALVPWFILVPKTAVTELCDLPAAQRQALNLAIDTISRYVRNAWQVDKLNVAAIGNIVKQLHIHVAGRRQGDYCWPGVVWGRPEKQPYTSDQVADLKTGLKNSLGEEYTCENS